MPLLSVAKQCFRGAKARLAWHTAVLQGTVGIRRFLLPWSFWWEKRRIERGEEKCLGGSRDGKKNLSSSARTP